MSGLRSLLPPGRPLLVLAPMQDVTDLPFWKVMHRYGGPDLYFTEYFRVHGDSKPEKWILKSIDDNPTGRPVVAQIIGQEIPALVRTAKALQKHPVAAIDLNLGCPAPIVCRKNAGGGLLRHPGQIEEILKALRDAIAVPFTVKTRIGYDSPAEFDALLDLFARHPLDAVSVHGRTVREMYRTEVHYDRIADAVRRLPCPVFANGNVLSARIAGEVAARTGAAGLMIGRGAIRNPWLFDQIRARAEGREPFVPLRRDLREYVEALYHGVASPDFREKDHVSKMKKYLNFAGQGLDPDDAFLREIRCAATAADFFGACDRHLLGARATDPVPDEPPRRSLLDARSEAMAGAMSG